MVCFDFIVLVGLFMFDCWFYACRLAVGLQGNPICTDDFSV